MVLKIIERINNGLSISQRRIEIRESGYRLLFDQKCPKRQLLDPSG
jgi:hypothetical protein